MQHTLQYCCMSVDKVLDSEDIVFFSNQSVRHAKISPLNKLEV